MIMEMDAENHEDESYYLSNSPVKRQGATSLNRNHNSKSNAAFGGGPGSLATVGPSGSESIQPSNQQTTNNLFMSGPGSHCSPANNGHLG